MHAAEGDNPAQFQCAFFGLDATLHNPIRERAREMVNGVTYTLWPNGQSGAGSIPAAAVKFVFVTRFTHDFRQGVSQPRLHQLYARMRHFSRGRRRDRQ